MAMPYPIPDPARIREYLTTHRWRKGWNITGGYGEMFVYEELADDGDEFTVFVPSHDLWEDYRYRVADIVDTLSVLERRPKEAVWADLDATAAVAGPAAVAAPAPAAPTDPVTP